MSAYLITTSAMQLIPLTVLPDESDEEIFGDISPTRKPLLMSSVPSMAQVFPLKETALPDTDDENSFFDQERIISA